MLSEVIRASPVRRSAPTPFGPAAAVGLTAGLVLTLVTRHVLCDDTYITLDYARNVAEHAHWGLVPDRTSNTATSPLNVWLLAVVVLVTRAPVVAVGVVLCGSLAAVGRAVTALAGGRSAAGVAAVALLATSPLLVSTVGLESFLAIAVLAALAAAAVAGRVGPSGLLAGLALLTRPDLAVPAAVLLLVLLPEGRRRAVGLATVVALPWHVFSWFVLGGFVPDTLWLKAGESSWEGYRFADGVGLYWRDFPAATVLTISVVVLGVALAVRSRGRVPLVLVAAAGAHLAAMAAIDSPPYAWYYAPAVGLCAVAAAASLGALRDPERLLATAVSGLVVVVAVALLVQRPWQVGPVVYNWGSAEQYARIGSETAQIVGDQPVAVSLEIGTVAYFCDCRLREMFTDPAVTRQVIDERLAGSGPAIRAALAVDVVHRPPSPVEPPPRWRLRGDAAGTPPAPGRWVWPIETPAHGAGVVVLERM